MPPEDAQKSKHREKRGTSSQNTSGDVGKTKQSVPIRSRDAPDPQASTALDATALFLGLTLVALLFNSLAPQPYMDEPFHVGQTQKYCQGQIKDWDPKITTFPGLYILGTLVGRCWHAVSASLPNGSKETELCSAPSLRAVNVGLTVVCYILTLGVYRKLHPGCRSAYASQMAMLVVLLPTSFFFVFLYYTDMGALTFFLAAYSAGLKQRYFLAGVLSAVSVMFRQTNAVWVVFILANKKKLASRLWAILLVPIGFAVFVIYNGGIVVGDKSNHTPQLHLVQPLYFVLFTVSVVPQVFFHPSRLSEGFRAATIAFRRGPANVLKPLGMSFVLTTYVVRNYSLAHPFLLADNRHYTFYLWKDIIAAYPAARYCLVPLYLLAGLSIIDRLKAGGQSKAWILAFFICTGLTLVPAWLLELRYFTIPCVLVLLHMKPPEPAVLLPSIVLFSAVNVGTIYMFLFRPYRWHDGSIARFIW